MTHPIESTLVLVFALLSLKEVFVLVKTLFVNKHVTKPSSYFWTRGYQWRFFTTAIATYLIATYSYMHDCQFSGSFAMGYLVLLAIQYYVTYYKSVQAFVIEVFY